MTDGESFAGVFGKMLERSHRENTNNACPVWLMRMVFFYFYFLPIGLKSGITDPRRRYGLDSKFV